MTKSLEVREMTPREAFSIIFVKEINSFQLRVIAQRTGGSLDDKHTRITPIFPSINYPDQRFSLHLATNPSGGNIMFVTGPDRERTATFRNCALIMSGRDLTLINVRPTEDNARYVVDKIALNREGVTRNTERLTKEQIEAGFKGHLQRAALMLLED